MSGEQDASTVWHGSIQGKHGAIYVGQQGSGVHVKLTRDERPNFLFTLSTDQAKEMAEHLVHASSRIEKTEKD